MKSSIRISRGGRSISFSGAFARAAFEGMTSTKLPPKTKFRSVAVWPKDVGINLGNEANESDDTHPTREAAEAVCHLLRTRGFGGDGKVFPTSTRVEEITA